MDKLNIVIELMKKILGICKAEDYDSGTEILDFNNMLFMDKEALELFKKLNEK